MTKSKTIPNIDLGGSVQIINEDYTPPRWHTLARVIATKENARRVARKHGLAGVWLLDDCGYREYITVK